MKTIYTGEYRMKIVCTSGSNKWLDHIIVKADSIEDARNKANDYAASHTNEKLQMRSTGEGYEMFITRGCRW